MERFLKIIFAAFWALIIGWSCTETSSKESRYWQSVESMPEPVSNNAVASVIVEGDSYIYSFMGLSRGKTYQDIHSRAFKYSVRDGSWNRIKDVPGDSGRLAGVAVTVDTMVYIFGGYTVAEDGSERSVPEVYKLDPKTDTYSRETRMPVPVDDAVAVVYKDRYIYLVSGWHNNDNVDNVQVYDTREKKWQQADSFPAPPVFGHAGGISGNRILITDGVKVVPHDEGRSFQMSPESWVGTINDDSLSQIDWKQIPHHPGAAKYRMAAMGDAGKVVFAGGTSNPYNYDGIGYDGVPSNPDSTIFSYNFRDSVWQVNGEAPVATMDHRSLLKIGGWYYLAGGMHEEQEVSDKVYRFKLQ